MKSTMPRPWPLSIFHLKIFLGYLVTVSLIPFITYLSEFGRIETLIEMWNWELGWDLVFSLLYFPAMVLALLNFRRMPWFGTGFTFWAIWYLWETFFIYRDSGFDSRFEIDLDPWGFGRGALVFAIPFFLLVLIRSAWNWWRSSHLVRA